MNNKVLLEKLNKKLQNYESSIKDHRCVGYDLENKSQYYFALSGAQLDYVGKMSDFKTTKNKTAYDKLQKDLFELMEKNNRPTVLVHLNDNCETIYGDKNCDLYIGKTNLYKFRNDTKYLFRKDKAGEVFSCVERKLIFSGFGGNQ